MQWWDVYIQELNCLTCSWASFVPLPLLYASSHHIVWCSYFSDCLYINWCQSFQKFFLESAKGIIAVVTKILLYCTPNSIKLSSQWNFRRKMQRCPATLITSWTNDFCCWPKSCQAQHRVAPNLHFGFLHSRCKQGIHRPCSSSMTLIPFGWFGFVGGSFWKIINWIIFTPLCMNQPSWSWHWLPPGFKFISETQRASGGYPACPWEWSAIISAW